MFEKLKRGELSWQKEEKELKASLPAQAQPKASAVPHMTQNRAELIVEEATAAKVSEAFAAIEKAKQDEVRKIEEAGSNPATHEAEEESHAETEKHGEEPFLEVPEELPRRIFPILRQRRRLLR